MTNNQHDMLNDSLAGVALAVVIAGAIPSCNLDGSYHYVELSDPAKFFIRGCG